MKIKEFFALAKMRLSTKAKSKDGVTLGLMPDYGFKGTGVRVDKVTPNKTAEKYGIKDGDIILKVGPHEVSGLMEYMSVLMKYEQNEKAEIHILRGEENIILKVQF